KSYVHFASIPYVTLVEFQLVQFEHGHEVLLKCLRRMYSKSRSWMLSEMPSTRLLVWDTL
ncbi:MAG: hypothetical protein O2931_07805, partial [Planctomycetota bacterium]|nr:hypothetical protein [Planctomycetota bacterium]